MAGELSYRKVSDQIGSHYNTVWYYADMSALPVPDPHPAANEFINLVVDGFTPNEATNHLVSKNRLTRNEALLQCVEWELDPEIQQIIKTKTEEKAKLTNNLRYEIQERLIATAFSDIRNYFTTKGPKPIHEWTKRESYAVKKIKFNTHTNPFGETTNTMELEFYDPMKAMAAIHQLYPETIKKTQTINIQSQKLEQLTHDELMEIHKRLTQ